MKSYSWSHWSGWQSLPNFYRRSEEDPQAQVVEKQTVHVGLTYNCAKERRGSWGGPLLGTFPPLLSTQPRGSWAPKGRGFKGLLTELMRLKLESKSRCSKGCTSPREHRRVSPPPAPEDAWGWALVTYTTPQGLCHGDLWGPRDISQGGRHCNSKSFCCHFFFLLLLCCYPWSADPTWIRRIWKVAGLWRMHWINSL